MRRKNKARHIATLVQDGKFGEGTTLIVSSPPGEDLDTGVHGSYTNWVTLAWCAATSEGVDTTADISHAPGVL